MAEGIRDIVRGVRPVALEIALGSSTRNAADATPTVPKTSYHLTMWGLKAVVAGEGPEEGLGRSSGSQGAAVELAEHVIERLESAGHLESPHGG